MKTKKERFTHILTKEQFTNLKAYVLDEYTETIKVLYNKAATDPRYKLLFCTNDNEVLGFIGYGYKHQNELTGIGYNGVFKNDDTCGAVVPFLHVIWTNPKHRNNGLATRLLHRVESLTQAQGTKQIVVDIESLDPCYFESVLCFSFKNGYVRENLKEHELIKRFNSQVGIKNTTDLYQAYKPKSTSTNVVTAS